MVSWHREIPPTCVYQMFANSYIEEIQHQKGPWRYHMHYLMADQGYMMPSINVNLHHLYKVVSARVLHDSVTIFPL